MAGEFTLTYKSETELTKDAKKTPLIDSGHTIETKSFKSSRKEINMETRINVKVWGMLLILNILFALACGSGVSSLKVLPHNASL